jgi:hypothetical protein
MIAPPKPPSPDQLEALIKEARDRQRRRRIGIAAGIALVAAAATSAYAVLADGTGKPAALPDRGRAPAAGPCKAASGWQLRPGPGWSEPTGQHTAPIILNRNGSSSCVLRGYPTVVLRTASGRTIPFRYTHAGDMVVADKPPQSVRVAGDGKAFFLFNKYRCDLHDTMISRWLLVRLPGVTGLLRLRMPKYPIMDFCPGGGPSTTIAVSPVVSRLAQAAARLP